MYARNYTTLDAMLHALKTDPKALASISPQQLIKLTTDFTSLCKVTNVLLQQANSSEEYVITLLQLDDRANIDPNTFCSNDLATLYSDDSIIPQHPAIEQRLLRLVALGDSKGWNELFYHSSSILTGLQCAGLQHILIASLSSDILATVPPDQLRQQLDHGLIPNPQQVKHAFLTKCPDYRFDDEDEKTAPGSPATHTSVKASNANKKSQWLPSNNYLPMEIERSITAKKPLSKFSYLMKQRRTEPSEGWIKLKAWKPF